LCAVVYPADRCSSVVRATGLDSATLERTSDGYRAILMSFAFTDAAHPQQAVEWAKQAATLVSSPLALYAGALAFQSWDFRTTMALHSVPLEDAFAPLAGMRDFLGNALQTTVPRTGRVCWISAPIRRTP